MTLSKRAILVILPVILISNILIALGVYWTESRGIEQAEFARVSKQVDELQAVFQRDLVFTQNLTFLMQSGGAIRAFARESDESFRNTAIGARLQDGIEYFAGRAERFVSFAILENDLSETYYFERSADPFASLGAAQLDLARQLVGGTRLSSDAFLPDGPAPLIIHSELMDPATLTRAFATQRGTALVVQAAVLPRAFLEMRKELESEYGTTAVLGPRPASDEHPFTAIGQLLPNLAIGLPLTRAYLEGRLQPLKETLAIGGVAVSLASIAILLLLIRVTVTGPIARLDRQVSDVLAGDRANLDSMVGTGEIERLSASIKTLHDQGLDTLGRVRHASRTDVLTGIGNRLHFSQVADRMVAEAQASGRKLCLLYIDIDNFKFVNDTYGHSAGDRVLQGFAREVQAIIESAKNLAPFDSFFARLSGDEFAVLVIEDGSAASALRIGRSIVNGMQDGLGVDGFLFPVTASIGLAHLPGDANSLDQLIACADRAMYATKTRGKNGLCRFGDLPDQVRRDPERQRLPLDHRTVVDLIPAEHDLLQDGAIADTACLTEPAERAIDNLWPRNAASADAGEPADRRGYETGLSAVPEPITELNRKIDRTNVGTGDNHLGQIAFRDDSGALPAICGAGVDAAVLLASRSQVRIRKRKRPRGFQSRADVSGSRNHLSGLSRKNLPGELAHAPALVRDAADVSSFWPLRFRDTTDGILFTDEAGGWFVSDDAFLDRYAGDELTVADVAFLGRKGSAFERVGDLAHSSFLKRWSGRHASRTGAVGYVILVPTLRCNLSCGYCQVSRAAESARGYDWTGETLDLVLSYLDGLTAKSPKIEFQGGEPLLRIDLLEKVRTFCRERFEAPSFVVCTNLQSMDERAWAFFADEDTYASTSIDGDLATHTRQRTFDEAATGRFLSNVSTFVGRFGTGRISALPTVDTALRFDADALIEAYARFGMTSIYLRPINRQGFARRVPEQGDVGAAWAGIHAGFVRRLIERNYAYGTAFEEFYFTHALKRVLRAGVDNHIDLRNPNLMGDGYIVIDYDGKFYPTDEARMISRIGKMDLSIGSVGGGIDRDRVRDLNAWSFNDLDPDCTHCAFQPFCGTDVVDDVSRYGRIDLPRADTWFCRRHTSLYDLVFELIRSTDPAVRHSLAMWSGVASWPASFAEVYR